MSTSAMPTMLEIKNLKFNLGNKKILDGVSLKVPHKKFMGIIGPNGAGKSTLLKNIYGIHEFSEGDILINGVSIKKISKKERAKKIAVLAQEEEHQFDFSVEKIVEMGRYPYKKFFEDYSEKDREIVYEMLKKTGMESYAERDFNTLSGGEKQRVLISRALAQKTDFLILDEPTNHLDIGYQLQIIDLIKHLDITVLSVFHDLNIAALFCDWVFVMKEGKIITEGTPEEIFTEKLLKDIFGINCHIGKNPVNNKIQISYITSHFHLHGIGQDHSHEDDFTGIHTHIIKP